MSRTRKAWIVCALHLSLVGTLAAKLLIDRATLPRVWVEAAPYDPMLPIRGRYLALQLTVDVTGEPPAAPASQPSSAPARPALPPSAQTAILRVDGGRLVAERKPWAPGDALDGLQLITPLRRGAPDTRDQRMLLKEPVAYFIPEHAADPSHPPPGASLWVEVTVPPKGPPRPIRLGLRKGDGAIEALALD